jgi:hypothetical protein
MPVVAVTESQIVDAAGTLTDVYEITFTVAGRPGSFTVTVPAGGDVVAAAAAAISAVESQVNSLYGL